MAGISIRPRDVMSAGNPIEWIFYCEDMFINGQPRYNSWLLGLNQRITIPDPTGYAYLFNSTFVILGKTFTISWNDPSQANNAFYIGYTGFNNVGAVQPSFDICVLGQKVIDAINGYPPAMNKYFASEFSDFTYITNVYETISDSLVNNYSLCATPNVYIAIIAKEADLDLAMSCSWFLTIIDLLEVTKLEVDDYTEIKGYKIWCGYSVEKDRRGRNIFEDTSILSTPPTRDEVGGVMNGIVTNFPHVFPTRQIAYFDTASLVQNIFREDLPQGQDVEFCPNSMKRAVLRFGVISFNDYGKDLAKPLIMSDKELLVLNSKLKKYRDGVTITYPYCATDTDSFYNNVDYILEPYFKAPLRKFLNTPILGQKKLYKGGYEYVYFYNNESPFDTDFVAKYTIYKKDGSFTEGAIPIVGDLGCEDLELSRQIIRVSLKTVTDLLTNDDKTVCVQIGKQEEPTVFLATTEPLCFEVASCFDLQLMYKNRFGLFETFTLDRLTSELGRVEKTGADINTISNLPDKNAHRIYQILSVANKTGEFSGEASFNLRDNKDIIYDLLESDSVYLIDTRDETAIAFVAVNILNKESQAWDKANANNPIEIKFEIDRRAEEW